MIIIATASSRLSKDWKNGKVTWDKLVERLSKNTMTAETMAEYKNMPKTEKDRIKDVGGFVGGYVKDGRRKAENVIHRSIITLDADYAGINFLEHLPDIEYVVYSTHSHTPDNPRLRVVVKLSRDVTPDEYQAIARRLAHTIGIQLFDDTTYEAHRLMYWPSSPVDGDVVFVHHKGETLDVDSILSTYADWQDTSLWHVSDRMQKARSTEIKKQGSPLDKKGVIGAFCRTYNIPDAITEFLIDVYTECAIEDRYTYANGSTVAGAIVYDDVFLYSNHSTDPVSGKLCNAWDLVRIHKFGYLDEDVENNKGNRLPSFKAMQELVLKDSKTTLTCIKEKDKELKDEFAEKSDWRLLLDRDANNDPIPTLKNALTVLKNDESLKGLAYNIFNDRIEIKTAIPWGYEGLQWRDLDDAQLLCYMSQYAKFSKNTVIDALAKVTDDRTFHPIRDYLESLPEWDGIDRVETLFSDYLGAHDTDLNRIMTRKTLCAAVARVYEPGIKFDTMLVLKGKQGIGKSRILKMLGVDWFSDSLKLSDTRDKTAVELIQGSWIIEISELAGLSRTDERVLKGFISRQDDMYRASYGRRVNSHPRQCVFVGTTNDDEFLTDTTGNRRYWIIPLWEKEPSYIIEDLSVNQIWAEALHIYKQGESLYLDVNTSNNLEKVHELYSVDDPQTGLILDFINRKIPVDWENYDINHRKAYWNSTVGTLETELMQRGRVCAIEVWCELFGNEIGKFDQREARRINVILKHATASTKNQIMRVSVYGLQRGYFVNIL